MLRPAFLSFRSCILFLLLAATGPGRADDPKDTALAQACYSGDLAKVTALISSGVPIEGRTGSFGFTPLMLAAMGGHLDVLKYLLSQHAEVDASDQEGSTPLLHAIHYHKDDCALALIEAGTMINAASREGRTPLMYAAKEGNDAIVSALIAHHADLNANCNDNNGPAVFWAAAQNHLSTLRLLVDAGARLDILPDLSPKGPSLMAKAAASANLDLLDYLTTKGVSVDQPCADKSTPLMFAAKWRRADITEWLLERGAAIEARNDAGETALIVGAYYGSWPVLLALLAHHAAIDAQDNQGQTGLMRLAMKGRTEVAGQLIAAGANIDIADKAGETALTIAGDTGNVDLVDMLKQKGAKRTDVHIIAKGNIPNEAPRPALPAAQTWALAVSAIYTQRFGQNPKVLGGDAPSAADEREMLKKDWQITDRKSLLHQLDEMKFHGHHEAYQKAGAKLAAMSDYDFTLEEAKALNHADQLKATRASYQKWKERSGAGWDLCRSAMLVNEGFAAHYIDEQEAWALLMPIARQAQAAFSSWQELNDNFLDGREIWANQRDPKFEACSQLLLNPQEPNSPWNQNPWKTDLADAGA